LAKRGSNSFRRNDTMRAIKAARDAGIDPSAVEVVVAPDGAVTFRVYGDRAAPTPAGAASDEWADAIEEAKAKTKAPKTKGR
jgi:hypothetical protein